MAIEFKKTKHAGHAPEIWRGECKMLPGGFKPVQDFPAGTLIRRGTPVYVDFDNMTAAVCKTATVLVAGSTTATVNKGHLFAVGDTVTVYGGAGTSTPTITAIDKSNTEYDVLTLSATLTTAVDDILVESETYSEEAVSTTGKYTPNMVIGADKEFDGKGIPTLDVAYDAVVLYPSLACPILDDWKTGPCLNMNPNILFIKQ